MVEPTVTNLTSPHNTENSQSAIAYPLKRTPLFDLCVELKARIVPFSGWEMPVQYNSGITQEHHAVRSRVGMFDISHMGMFRFQGQQLIEKLQFLVPSDLARLHPGEAQYTVLLNANAGILDDIIFYYQGFDSTTGEHRGVMIVNATTRASDQALISSYLEGSDVQFADISQEKVLIAVQGPQALTFLQHFVEADINALKNFGHLETNVLGKPTFIARTGYTGEDGFEVMIDIEEGKQLWQNLLNAGVIPCGLGARDTLRLEAAMALYSQDITETTTPLEAGLGWLVHLDKKGDFIGRDILEKQKENGVSQRLVGLELPGRHIARHGYPVFFNNELVGEVTSGTLSPTLNKAIALVYLPSRLGKLGTQLDVEIRGKTYPATVVKRPFYRSPHRI
jgi:aminomethyltransferase